MKSGFIPLFMFFAAFQSGCATPPDKISASYVSPVQYRDYDCEQIAMEMRIVGGRINALHYELEEEATDDSAQMGIGLLFWPLLFFLEGGDDARAEEYALLKGEQEALQNEAVTKKCDPASLPEF